MRFQCHGRTRVVTFEVANVVRPILSASRLVEKGFAIVVEAGKDHLQRRDVAGTTLRVPLPERSGLYFLPVRLPTGGLVAPVEVPDGAEDAPPEAQLEQPPEATEDIEMECATHGLAAERPEEAPPAPVEMRAPAEPLAEDRRLHALSHLPYQPWCEHCIRGRGRGDRHVVAAREGGPVIECH